jgi:predicted RNA binding protein YcfA (HicA-like mRNA interferase family)
LTQLPAVTGKEVVAALRRLGFEILRVKGSHHFMRHRDGRSTVVPVHAGEDVGPGLMSKILRDTKLTKEELKHHL